MAIITVVTTAMMSAVLGADRVEVRDDCGNRIDGVVELNLADGWLIRHAGLETGLCDGTPGCAKCGEEPHIRTEKRAGYFELVFEGTDP